MEFYFSGFLAAVSIHILDLDDLRYEFDNVDQFVNFININNIDDLLLKEFAKFWVHLLE